jgi:hypothetical protein
MVRKEGGGWHPACLLDKEGKKYRIRFVGADGDAVVDGENVRHLFAANPEEKIPRGLFRRN